MDSTAISLLIGFAALLGLNQALVKIVNTGFAPVFQAGLRSLCAFVPVLLFAWLMKRRLSINDGTLLLGLLNGCLFSIEFCLLFLALDFSTVSRVSLFFYTMPIWVALGAHFLIANERLTLTKLLGLLVAVAGLAMALIFDDSTQTRQYWLGDGLALLAAFAWAGIALLTKTTRLVTCSAEMNLLYQLAVSAAVLLALAPLFGDTIRDVTPEIIGIFAFQVLAIAAVGFLLWFWVLSVYPVSQMSSFALLTPIFGILSGWLIFDDQLTPTFFVAFGLVCVGLMLISRPQTN